MGDDDPVQALALLGVYAVQQLQQLQPHWRADLRGGDGPKRHSSHVGDAQSLGDLLEQLVDRVDLLLALAPSDVIDGVQRVLADAADGAARAHDSDAR